MIKYDHLIGLPYEAGKNDCIGLVRQLYTDNWGIKIRNIARPSDWDADKLDLIRLCYEGEGFDIVPRWKPKDLMPGDVLAMSVRSSNPNHLAVFVGDNTIIHHKLNCFSDAEVLRDTLVYLTSFVLRHPDVPKYCPDRPDVKIEDLLSERYKLQATGILPS